MTVHQDHAALWCFKQCSLCFGHPRQYVVVGLLTLQHRPTMTLLVLCWWPQGLAIPRNRHEDACLPRTSIGSWWGKMMVELSFSVKANLYDEADITGPKVFFLCNKLLFMVCWTCRGWSGLTPTKAQHALHLHGWSLGKAQTALRAQLSSPNPTGEVNPSTSQHEVKDTSWSVKRGKYFSKSSHVRSPYPSGKPREATWLITRQAQGT